MDTNEKESEGLSNEEQPFNIDRALGNGEFAKYLSSLDQSSFDINDPESVRAKFEIFESKEKVGKRLSTFVREQLKRDLGLTFSDETLKKVEEEVERLSTQDPDRVIELDSQLQNLVNFSTKINELQEKLKQTVGSEDLKKKIDELENDRNNALLAREGMGLIGGTNLIIDSAQSIYKNALILPRVVLRRFFPSWEKKLVDNSKQEGEAGQISESVIRRTEAIELTREKYGKDLGKRGVTKLLIDLEKKIKEEKAQLEKVSSAETLLASAQKHFNGIRAELINHISGIASLRDAVQAEVRATFVFLTKEGQAIKDMPPNLDHTVKASKLFEDLEKRRVKSELNIDPFGAFEDKGKLMDAINDETVQAIGIEIDKALKKPPKALQEIEYALHNILRMKELALLRDRDAIEILANIFEDTASNLSKAEKDTDKRIKAIFLNRIAGKLRSGAYNS